MPCTKGRIIIPFEFHCKEGNSIRNASSRELLFRETKSREDASWVAIILGSLSSPSPSIYSTYSLNLLFLNPLTSIKQSQWVTLAPCIVWRVQKKSRDFLKTAIYLPVQTGKTHTFGLMRDPCTVESRCSKQIALLAATVETTDFSAMAR